MGLPKAPEARQYYRAAKQRFAEAEILLNATTWKTGAVYLAGYTVECLLKALILDGVAPHLRKKLLAEFRGQRAHDINWLKDKYRQHVRGSIPSAVTRHLARVAHWDTDFRYATTARGQGDPEEFIESVVQIATWAEGRM
jgi:hypothetical protein